MSSVRWVRLFVCLLPSGAVACGGDAAAVHPAPSPDAHYKAGADAGHEALEGPDARPDTALESGPETGADGADGASSEAEPDANCADAPTVTIEVDVFRRVSNDRTQVMAHCPDGTLYATTETDTGKATMDVPVGGLLTATCLASLTTVGGIETSGSVKLACARVPGKRPPGGLPQPCDYTVTLASAPGAKGYQVRGTAGSVDVVDPGPVSLQAYVGKGDIVAYALDAQGRRIAAASRLAVDIDEGAIVDMGAFHDILSPAMVSLVHPRVENDYDYSVTLETWRTRMIETASWVTTLESGDAASLSATFAAGVAQWHTLKVHYALAVGQGQHSSELYLREPADFDYTKEIDLTTGILPLMLSPSLLPVARPILNFVQVGPATCVTGASTELLVELSGTHPDGRYLHWNLKLPGDTEVPWLLPELDSDVESSYWPGAQITNPRVALIRQTEPDPVTGVPACISKSM